MLGFHSDRKRAEQSRRRNTKGEEYKGWLQKWVPESLANEHQVSVEFWEEIAVEKTHSLIENHLL